VEHPNYHKMYDFPEGIPKIHLNDGEPPRGYGIFHGGRLVVYYSFETDLGNGWEDAKTYDDTPAVRERAFRMGVNIFLYALSQVAS
jgi:hypothetical protein